MYKRLSQTSFQEHVEHFFSQAHDSMSFGKHFLETHFHGLHDPDVTHEHDVHRAIAIIQDRYVCLE